MSTEVEEPPSDSDEVATEIAASAAPDIIANSLGEYARIWLTKVRSGESGALPVILGLVVIVVYFQVRSSLFLSAGNLVNLMTAAAWIMMLGMAEVFVLLLGEIDLSIGYTSAIGATFTLWICLLYTSGSGRAGNSRPRPPPGSAAPPTARRAPQPGRYRGRRCR